MAIARTAARKPMSDMEVQRSGATLPQTQRAFAAGARGQPAQAPQARVPRSPPPEPAPRGIGAANIEQLIAALTNVDTKIKTLPTDLRKPFSDTSSWLIKVLAIQSGAVTSFVRGTREAERVAKPAIERMAESSTPVHGFPNAADRQGAKKSTVDREMERAVAAVMSRVHGVYKIRAAKAAEGVAQSLLDAKRAVAKARLRGRFASAEADPKLVKSVEARIASLPTAIKATACMEWFAEAAELDDRAAMHAVAVAGLPVIQELLEDRVLQTRVAKFTSAGTTTKLVAHATAFVNNARAFLKQIAATPEIEAAHACWVRLREIAVRAIGIDPANPDVVSAGRFSTLMSGGGKPFKMDDDGIVFAPDGPKWITRFANSSYRMPAFSELVVPPRSNDSR